MENYVEFPALGWHFPLSDTIAQFELFGMPLTIKWYGVLIAVGFLLAVIYAIKRAKYFEIDPDRMIDVVLIGTLIAFVGARLYYVLFSSPDTRDAYFANPLSILYIWEGGLGIYGGLIFAFLAAILLCRWRRVNTLALFDLASLGFLIGQAIGRWGNFFNQEAFGCNTDLLWGMTGNVIAQGVKGEGYDPALPVHPTFLYESLWCILGFVLLHLISKKAYKFKGQIFSLYIIWYGAGRFFIELLRTDSLMLGNMKVSCFVAVLAVIGGLMLAIIFRNRALGLAAALPQEDGLPQEQAAESYHTIDIDEDALTPETAAQVEPQTEETEETENGDNT